MLPTADPDTWIEERRNGYVRYRRRDGRRWEVWGVCYRWGLCLIGAVISTPDGPIQIRDSQHLEELKHLLGRERIDSELDVPVTPEFRDCCPFTYVELDRADSTLPP